MTLPNWNINISKDLSYYVNIFSYLIKRCKINHQLIILFNDINSKSFALK